MAKQRKPSKDWCEKQAKLAAELAASPGQGPTQGPGSGLTAPIGQTQPSKPTQATPGPGEPAGRPGGALTGGLKSKPAARKAKQTTQTTGQAGEGGVYPTSTGGPSPGMSTAQAGGLSGLQAQAGSGAAAQAGAIAGVAGVLAGSIEAQLTAQIAANAKAEAQAQAEANAIVNVEVKPITSTTFGSETITSTTTQGNALLQPPAIVELPTPHDTARVAQVVNEALAQFTQASAGPTPGQAQAMTPPVHFSVTPQSAAEQALAAIDSLLAEQDDALSGPMQALHEATYNSFTTNNQVLTKITQKITRAGDQYTTQVLNAIDSVFTTINNYMETSQFDVHFLLTQLAAKAGFTEPGQQLESALEETTEAKELSYGPTMTLDCRGIGQWFEDLIEVLREIRDRMQPTPLHIHGTPRAMYPSSKESPEVDTKEEEAEPEEPDIEPEAE